MLDDYDRRQSSSASPSGGFTHPIDLTAEDDEAPGPSRRRHSPHIPNGSIYPQLPPRLFPEGSLNPDSPSPSFGPNGSVDSDQSDEPDPEDSSESKDSPENPISPVVSPQSPSIPRRPPRPDVTLESRYERDYGWLRKSRSTGSTSSRSSRSSKRSTSKYHSARVTKTWRSHQQKQREQDWHERRVLEELVAKGDDRIGKSGQRVLDLLKPKWSLPSRKQENLFHRRESMIGQHFSTECMIFAVR